MLSLFFCNYPILVLFFLTQMPCWYDFREPFLPHFSSKLSQTSNQLEIKTRLPDLLFSLLFLLTDSVVISDWYQPNQYQHFFVNVYFSFAFFRALHVHKLIGILLLHDTQDNITCSFRKLQKLSSVCCHLASQDLPPILPDSSNSAYFSGSFLFSTGCFST